MAPSSAPFWETKSLSEMTHHEWEALCDGCGRCCLNKLEDDETGAIAYTDVACRLLDINRCRCQHYAQRTRLVPDCIVLTPTTVGRYRWLPPTCAYRRLAEGKELLWWHPLVSGDPNTVHRVGISVRGKVISEDSFDSSQLTEHIVDWVESEQDLPKAQKAKPSRRKQEGPKHAPTKTRGTP